jgi:uncharacterized protein (TIGR02679 family)
MIKASGGENRAKAKTYFSQPGFRRMLTAVWRRYESLERIGGNAVVRRVSPAESEAVNLFFGLDTRPGEDVSVPLAVFEQELRESAFSLGIVELHVLIEGEPLLTKSEKQLLKNTEWRRLFHEVHRFSGGNLSPVTSAWLTRLANGQGGGWRTLREVFRDSPEKALDTLSIVVRALDLLFTESGRMKPVRLPVLAARVSGDAHALDANQPAGRMFVAVLQEIHSGEIGQQSEAPEENDDGPDSAEEDSRSLMLRQMYRMHGILDDDLSSVVYWYVPEPGLPVIPNVWTLRQVESADLLPCCSAIYVVENPAVFSTILDSVNGPQSFAGNPPALVCTSGPASAAAVRWLQRCLKASGEPCLIHYSGDFDVKGISMAQTLESLFPDRFNAWRFDSETYKAIVNSPPGAPLDEVELSKLEKLNVSWDDQLCAAMRQMGRKVHQEAFVDQMVKDWNSRFVER